MSAPVELTEVKNLIFSARKKTVFRQADSVDGDAAFSSHKTFMKKLP